MENVVIDLAPQTKSKLSLRRKPFALAVALAFSILSAPAMAAVDLGIDASELQSLILGLIATIALIGTAYLTVLVATSAFSMIRRVVRG